MAIACACLLAGFAASALVYRDRGGPGGRASAEGAPRQPDLRVRDPRGAGGTEGGKDAEIEPLAPGSLDVRRMVSFAETFFQMEDTASRAEATMAWFDAFGDGDHEFFVSQLFALDGEEDAAGALDESELELIFEFVDRVFDDDEKILGSYFCESWARSDPDSLSSALLTMPLDYALSLSPYTLPFLWATDPELGRRTFEELRNRDRDEFEYEFEEDDFAHQMFQVDEVAAVRWMIDHATEDVDYDEVFSGGIGDPDGVLKELMTIAEGEHREDVIEWFFDFQLEADPGSALDLLQRYSGELELEYQEDIEIEATIAWMLEDPAARIRSDDDELMYEVLGEWVVSDPQGALAWVDQLGLDAGEHEQLVASMVGSSFSDLPFDLAIEHATDNLANLGGPRWAVMLSDEQLGQLIEKVPAEGLAELKRRDPAAALELAGDLDGLLEQDEVIDSLDFGGNEDREQWLPLLPDSARARFFTAWASDDPVAAWQASGGDASAAGHVVETWLGYDDAANVYAAVSGRFDESEEVREPILEAWAKHDPWGAGETLLADGRGDSVPLLIDSWLKRDSVEASRFVRENLEPGPQRDRAAEAIARGIVIRDPEAAHEWAVSIGDEQLREEVVADILREQAP